MSDVLHAHRVLRRGHGRPVAARIALDYEGRFLRRKRLICDDGTAVLVDLAETTSLDDGDALELADGRFVAIAAAAEPVLEIRGDLARLAWHIGNRHTPCQIGADRLVIRADPVLADMLRRLGAELCPMQAPFTPEGGAYGHGRTLGHDHSHSHDQDQIGAHLRVHHHGSHTGPDEATEDEVENPI